MSNNSKEICAAKTGVELICGTDLDPKSIAWIWNNWLAAGKFHLLAGAPGTGKTTIALSLAATITIGGQWPDGSNCQPGNVLIWSGEDDPQDALLPRLIAHGVDRSHVYFVSDVFEHNKPRAFDPSRDMLKLYEKAMQLGEVRLIIVDPVVNAVASDSHKNGEVRRDLQPLVELGDKLKAAILGISHFTKGTIGRDPIERVTGSIAFGALARVVLATAKMTDPNGNLKRVLVKVKSNYSPDGGGYNYQIEQIELENFKEVFSSQVIWGEPVIGNARELLVDINDQGNPDERSILAEAMNFLTVLLADGPLPKKEVSERAKDAGFRDITIRRAKTSLGVEAVHEGYGKGSVWKWYLPSKVLKSAKDTHANGVSDFKNKEQLLSQLMQTHPPIVEGCKLSDILLHAIPEDYEYLEKPEVMAIFARSLRDSGKIKIWQST